MKKYGKLLGSLLALVMVIGLAAFIYGKLKAEMEAPSLLESKATKDEIGEENDNGQKTEDKTAAEENDGESSQEEESQNAEDSTQQRQAAIDVKVYDSEGNPVQLSDFYGKPVVMNFWATWCGYCKQEMPDFQEIYDEYGDKVEFLFINSTDGGRETKEKAMAYLEEEGYTFPAYYDEDLEAVYTYSVNSLPTTILLDKEAKVAAYVPGMIQKEPLMGALDVLLEE